LARLEARRFKSDDDDDDDWPASSLPTERLDDIHDVDNDDDNGIAVRCCNCTEESAKSEPADQEKLDEVNDSSDGNDKRELNKLLDDDDDDDNDG
jgi:hypothetical protein